MRKLALSLLFLVVLAMPASAAPTIVQCKDAGGSQGACTDGSIQTAKLVDGASFVTLTGSQILTNKTLNCANNTCTVRLGSDVTGITPLANGGTASATGDLVATNNLTTPLLTSTGVLSITSAAGTGASAGSALTITAGVGSTSGAGGTLTASGGAGGATGNGGPIILNGGNGGTGFKTGGSITLTGGTGGSTGGSPGAINLVGGTPQAGTGGVINLTGGVGVGSGAGGSLNLTGGNSGATGVGGGGVLIVGGVGPTGNTSPGGGHIIRGGAAGAGSNGAGGTVDILGGNGNGSASGGSVTVIAGLSGLTGSGAFALLQGGRGGFTSGNGGLAQVQGGQASISGTGGAVAILGGAAAGAAFNGGAININGGPLAGTGVNGSINIGTTNAAIVTIGKAGGSISLGDGVVTQATSVTTDVTLNSSSGVITTFSQSALAGATSTFTVTNSCVVAGSVVGVTVGNYAGTYGTNGIPLATVSAISAGSFDVTIINGHALNALSGVLKLNFTVL